MLMPLFPWHQPFTSIEKAKCMPTTVLHLQKQFKLTFVEDLPEAMVEVTQNEYWLRCCPLCGCTHQVVTDDEKLPYTPLCQTVPLIYKSQQTIWRKLYPDVAKYTSVHLTIKQGKGRS